VGIFLAILALGLLIVVHELGHMMVARLSGMRVERFSVGFGPPLLRWRGKKTTYQLALIPLGGFVEIAGMNPHEQLAPDDQGSYAKKSPWRRFATILAGPLTNYLFAIVIMIAVGLAWGLPRWQLSVGEVLKGSAAEAAKLQPGDSLLSVAGKPVTGAEGVIEIIAASEGRPLTLELERNGQRRKVTVSARRDDDTWRIGIGFARKLSFTSLSVKGALLLGLLYPVDQTRAVLSGLGQLFKRKVSLKQVGGPVEIIRQLTMSFKEGLAMALLFLAMLNVYLGLFNLLPIPALDGARLVFLGFTIITRRPVNQKVEAAVHTVGFIVLLGLILLVTYKDLARIFGSK